MTNSRKRTALLIDTFSIPRGYPLTRELTLLLFSFVMIELLAPIDGHWGRWSQWGACDAKCGFGKHYRTRSCDDPKPKYGGKGCSGTLNETKACKLKSCGIGEYVMIQCRSWEKTQFDAVFSSSHRETCLLYLIKL